MRTRLYSLDELDDIPGTTVFTAKRSRQAYHLHKFCMSLMEAANREVFKQDERAYLDGFRMSEEQAHRVMITAHRRGACVVAVFTKDVAETKATRATDAGRAKGYPLLFTTEPEE